MIKWDFKTREYEPYIPDPSWNIKLISDDMEELIDCANCGTHVIYGRTYTSRAIHTSIGLGYPVCGACYDKELKLEKKYAAK